MAKYRGSDLAFYMVLAIVIAGAVLVLRSRRVEPFQDTAAAAAPAAATPPAGELAAGPPPALASLPNQAGSDPLMESIPPAFRRKDFGYASPDGSIRLFKQEECENELKGKWNLSGECLKSGPEGGSYSWDFRGLNTIGGVKPQPLKPMPAPQPQPQPQFERSPADTLSKDEVNSLRDLIKRLAPPKPAAKPTTAPARPVGTTATPVPALPGR
jgi:hypothetical protein